MNEHIRKLMLEAGYAAPELAGRANKLAELIVRECAKVAGQEQIYNERNEIPVNIEESVLEHFGVEE